MSCILRLRRMGEGPLRELFEINCQFQKGDCPRFLQAFNANLAKSLFACA